MSKSSFRKTGDSTSAMFHIRPIENVKKRAIDWRLRRLAEISEPP